jgi:hypothetical protein
METMGLFKKKFELKKVWQKIKKDAEKARDGKKPGGKMGFETALENLDKAVLAKTPDADDIMTKTGRLTSDMMSYAASLPPEEKQFAADIKGFVKILQEIARACEMNARDESVNSKELLQARNKMSRINQIGDALQARLVKLRKELEEYDGDPKGYAALSKEVSKQDDAVQELGKQMGDIFEVVMRLTN